MAYGMAVLAKPSLVVLPLLAGVIEIVMRVSWVNLGALLASEGRIDEARRAYGRAMEIEPGSKMARAGLSKLEVPAK